MKLKQLSLFVENRPGAINAPCQLLAEHGVNISTLSLADSKFFGVLRLLIGDWQNARRLLEEAGFAVKLTDVVAIEVDHQPGSLSKVLAVLDKYAINVEYMYAYAAGIDGKAVLIFRFDDPDEAIHRIGGELRVMTAENLFPKA